MSTPQLQTGSTTYQISEEDTDTSGRARFEVLLEQMQQVAWENSVRLGFSVPDLQKKGLTWMVHRMQFHLKRFPGKGEEIRIVSWPSGQDRLYTYRDYKILDQDDEVVLRGTSAWLMIDLEKRRPVAPAGVFNMEIPEQTERIALDKQKLVLSTEAETLREFTVSKEDMDLNEHVSNVRYVQWALEAADKSQTPKFLDMIFREESVAGDKLAIRTDGLSSHQQVIGLKHLERGSDAFLLEVKYT